MPKSADLNLAPWATTKSIFRKDGFITLTGNLKTVATRSIKGGVSICKKGIQVCRTICVFTIPIPGFNVKF